jgi:[ribosomal protein S5]-alanine N-acetyltransferase
LARRRLSEAARSQLGSASRFAQRSVYNKIDNPLNTKNLILAPHVPAHLLALMESVDAYEEISGKRLANGVRDFLLSASPDFALHLRSATEPDPWRFGFATIHRIDNVVIGMCGFAGPPDSDGVVEIAYSIAPDYEGRGYATEAAGALIEFASQSSLVRTISAYTLREISASTHVLEKCDFRKTGELIDSENNPVWRWEKQVKNDEGRRKLECLNA